MNVFFANQPGQCERLSLSQQIETSLSFAKKTAEDVELPPANNLKMTHALQNPSLRRNNMIQTFSK